MRWNSAKLRLWNHVLQLQRWKHLLSWQRLHSALRWNANQLRLTRLLHGLRGIVLCEWSMRIDDDYDNDECNNFYFNDCSFNNSNNGHVLECNDRNWNVGVDFDC